MTVVTGPYMHGYSTIVPSYKEWRDRNNNDENIFSNKRPHEVAEVLKSEPKKNFWERLAGWIISPFSALGEFFMEHGQSVYPQDRSFFGAFDMDVSRNGIGIGLSWTW